MHEWIDKTTNPCHYRLYCHSIVIGFYHGKCHSHQNQRRAAGCHTGRPLRAIRHRTRDPVVLEPSESGIVMRPMHAVIREVQAYFADAAPPDVVLSEELLRDRRAEAEQENRG
jgi:hypothetical protein